MSQIVKGDDREIKITMRQKTPDGKVGDPLDLTGKTVKMAYKNESGVRVEINATVDSAILGKITVPFTDVQSQALKVGDFKFDIIVDEAGDTQTYPIQNKITIKDKNS